MKVKVGDFVKFNSTFFGDIEDITVGKTYKIEVQDNDGELYFIDDVGERNFATNYYGCEVVDVSKQDMINSPSHYKLFDGVEVKDVVKEVLRRWQDECDLGMSFNQAGMMKEALQYLLRAPKKNNKEDVSKAIYYLNEIVKEWDE